MKKCHKKIPKYRKAKNSREDIERIYKIIDDILNLDGCIFIVEGKKDIESLVFLGINKSQIYAVSNKETSKIVNAIQGKKIIDFLDNDKEGHNIRENLVKHNVYVDSKYKNDLFKLLRINKTEEIKRKIIKLGIKR